MSLQYTESTDKNICNSLVWLSNNTSTVNNHHHLSLQRHTHGKGEGGVPFHGAEHRLSCYVFLMMTSQYNKGQRGLRNRKQTIDIGCN